jgi:hypothetical protein
MSGKIVLQFAAMDDPASEAIKFFERGWPSHVDAVLPDGRLLGARSDVVMGIPAGVQIRPAGYEEFTRTCVLTLETDPEIEKAFYSFLFTQLGKPYDKTAIVAFAFHRDWQEEDSWFCSEMQAAALLASKFLPNPLSEVANVITPRDCLLIASPWGTCVYWDKPAVTQAAEEDPA